ncbi:MAG: GIY-YIG nuclease family protein [Burkholderiales bacterium]|nr:GIY-YIG nuclease family protein [Burkholderiales bacterium]
MSWWVYIVRCSDGSLYTGIARDVERRLDEHNGSDRLGARYTRARRPVVLVYREGLSTRSQASRREAIIKRMTRVEKERLVAFVAGATNPSVIPAKAAAHRHCGESRTSPSLRGITPSRRSARPRARTRLR